MGDASLGRGTGIRDERRIPVKRRDGVESVGEAERHAAVLCEYRQPALTMTEFTAAATDR